MASQIKLRLVVTNLVSSNGACRIQLLGGQEMSQFFIADLELTAAQNAALTVALAATAATVTNFDFAEVAIPLPGLTNAV